MKRRPWIGNLLLLVCSVALTCAAAETWLRLFRPLPLDASYAWPDGTARHRPSFGFTYSRQEFSSRIRYNSDGMRGPEIAPSKRPGVPRVLFLGDSFVEGKQVADDEVVSSVMERLSDRRGRPLEVINAGVAGYGTGEELYLWRHWGRRLDPDVVLVGFYPNDVRNNGERRLYEIEGDGLRLRRKPVDPKVRWIYAARKFLASHFHLYILFKMGLDALEAPEGQQGNEGPAGPAVDLAFDKEGADASWNLTLALLDRLSREVEEAGARFVLVSIPTRYEVDDSLWELTLGKADPSAFDLEEVSLRLSAWARQRSVPLVDLREPMRRLDRDNDFYFDIDAHWRPAGHRLAAETILEALAREGILG